jgi:hypothetical protein
MGTMKRLALALGGVVNVGKKGFLSGMVDGERDFIQFFERSVASLTSGMLLGIKLYQWCVTQDIPITTYCQKGSYSAGSAEKKALVANTKPRNWRNLLEIPGLETLRVNLAHMGGDDAIETLFKGGKVTPRGWTYTIIQMLKKYPNVYADLSASDYHAQGGASRIRRIFELDKKGQFGAGHSLEDKVLWDQRCLVQSQWQVTLSSLRRAAAQSPQCLEQPQCYHADEKADGDESEEVPADHLAVAQSLSVIPSS